MVELVIEEKKLRTELKKLRSTPVPGFVFILLHCNNIKIRVNQEYNSLGIIVYLEQYESIPINVNAGICDIWRICLVLRIPASCAYSMQSNHNRVNDDVSKSILLW